MKFLFSTIIFSMALAFAAHASTPDSIDLACISAAADAVIDANNNAPDPEITPPAKHAFLLKIVKSGKEYQMITDKKVKYDVLTQVKSNGTCEVTDVSGL